MPVVVVNVRIVRVVVDKLSVPVCVPVRLASVPLEIVHVLVMLVMAMRMSVLQRLVGVAVRMCFADVQPHACRHQCGSGPKQRRRRISKRDHGNQHSEEWGGGEICAGSGRAQTALREHEQHQAHAIAG